MTRKGSPFSGRTGEPPGSSVNQPAYGVFNSIPQAQDSVYKALNQVTSSVVQSSAQVSQSTSRTFWQVPYDLYCAVDSVCHCINGTLNRVPNRTS